MNHRVEKAYIEGCSLRGIARTLGLSRTTVARKFVFLGINAERELEEMNQNLPKVAQVQFDEQETAESTKLKPLSILMVTEKYSHRILGFEISEIPASGRNAEKSRKKYGRRPDRRSAGRRKLFSQLKPFIEEQAIVESDDHPHYPSEIKIVFPQATHRTHKARPARDHGFDELKKGKDPLFSINHVLAKQRARMSRLARKSWCISKRKERLRLHLAIFAVNHNRTRARLEKHFERMRGSG
jgi:hypothetical protein